MYDELADLIVAVDVDGDHCGIDAMRRQQRSQRTIQIVRPVGRYDDHGSVEDIVILQLEPKKKPALVNCLRDVDMCTVL